MQNTTHYALPTWEKDDQIKMSDFNAMTAKLDAALKSNADALAFRGTPRQAAPRLRWRSARATPKTPNTATCSSVGTTRRRHKKRRPREGSSFLCLALRAVQVSCS